MVADHGQQDVALVDRIAQVLAKVDAQGYGVNVDEDGPVPEMSLQPVVEPSGDVGAILATVGQKKIFDPILAVCSDYTSDTRKPNSSILLWQIQSADYAADTPKSSTYRELWPTTILLLPR